jgi:hypothetical protein
MGQNVLILPPAPPAPAKNPADKPPSRPKPVKEWVLIGMLTLLLLAVVTVALYREQTRSRGSACCAAGADSEALERYMARCTRDDGLTPTDCAEMWERVTGTPHGL